MTIVFANKATADAILKEICRTPGPAILEDASEACWLWASPEANINQVSYATDATGRCAIAHPFNEVTEDWLRSYIADWLADNAKPAGDVVFLDAGLPANWVNPVLP